MRGFSVVRAAVVMTAMLVAAPVATAQSQPDARWQPWLGCWVANLPRTAGASETMVCVVPEESGAGVELTVIANNKVAHRELVSAAGVRTPKVFDTCPGWESASFSRDERRIFLRSEFACGKTTVDGSGVFAISDAGEWIEVRGSIIGGRSTVRAVRYRPAGRTLRRLAAGTASDSMPYAVVDEREAARHQRFAAGAPLSTDAVLEVAKSVQTPVAEAWLNELGQVFALNGKELVRLADAGMPPSVIDLMVALSYPKRFALQRAEYQPTGAGGAITIESPRTLTDDSWSRRRENCGYSAYPGYYGDPCYPGYFGYGVYGYDPFFNSAYARMYGYNYGYNYYGSYYGGYYGGYYWGSRPIIIVNTGTTGDYTPASRGQAVKGQGYTRPSSGGSPSTNTSGSSGSAGSSGSSSGSSSAGSSSAGSSSSGRTAKPRPPA